MKASQIFKIFLLLCLLSPIQANTLEWNFFANPIPLDLPATHYVGQLIYQGEGGNTIEVTNIGLRPYGEANDRFYYTHQNLTPSSDSPYNWWQRVLFEVTIKGHRHNSGKVEVLNIDKPVLQYSGDSFTIPIGAAPSVIPNPGFVEGYNSEGVWGKGSNYRYRYPYEFITIELTAIPTTESNLTGRHATGIYESNLFFSGDNLSLILPLEGRRGESLVTEGHTFSIEMVGHKTLPFEQLTERDSFTNRLRVGTITYSSFDTGATLSFASDTTHRAVDFNLASTKDSFPFSLVFESNLPPKGAKKVTGISSIFPTTTHQLSTTGSTDTKVVNEYLLSGEVGIYVDSSLRYNRLADDFYSTEIYCILTIW